MGTFIRQGRRNLILILMLAMASLQGGCQLVGMPTVSSKKLVRYQSMLDLSGLNDASIEPAVRVKIATPANWEALPAYKGALYVHQQWRSTSHHNGVGVVYIRMPLPFSAETLERLAAREYTNHADDGKILSQWTDGIGRPWFEAENKNFHVRGYVVTDGLDAWIVYAGCRSVEVTEPEEISLASRSLESIVPIPRSEEIPPALETAEVVASKPQVQTTNQ